MTALRKGPLWGLALFVLAFAADQYSKYWILYRFHLPARQTVEIMPFLNFTMVWNHAVTFGLLSQVGKYAPLVFCTVSLVAIIVLLVMMTRTRRFVVALACGAIAGGALGNIVDRLRYGAVVDFLHVHVAGWSWYVFNVADSGIVCGVIAWLMDSLLHDHRPAGK